MGITVTAGRMQRQLRAVAASSKRWLRIADHSQVYNAAGTSLVTGPISLAGATGAGTSESPFAKTIALAYGEYTVGCVKKAAWLAAVQNSSRGTASL